MIYLTQINGDLLEATEDYIVHQCNCVTNHSKHLAKSVFDAFPHANTYKTRSKDKNTHHTPGTIDIMGDGINKRFIINAYAQYYPSKSKYTNDNPKNRLQWFNECLQKISQIKDIKKKTVAFPFNIGCGSAGGNWDEYYEIIQDFANKEKIYITLYKLNS